MSRKGWLVGAVIAMASVVASAGPFGLNQGDTIEAVSKFAKLMPAGSPGIYKVDRLPNGHPDIENYRLVFGDATGLCRVNAWTPTKPTGVYGNEVRIEVAGWQEALTAKYGAPKKVDYLHSDSIWREPRDWTMALAKKERTLAAMWEFGAAPADGLSSIKVEAFALTSGTYMVSLVYEFSNFDACKASLTSKRNANL